MSGSFTNDQTAKFTLEGSTFTYTANGSETAAQARDRLLTNPGGGEFQGSNGEIIELIDTGKIKISDKTGKALFTVETDGTTTGLKFTEISADGSFAISNLSGNVPPNNLSTITSPVAVTLPENGDSLSLIHI